MADAVKSTISSFQQPSYYSDPIAQADSSNWAPEPYQSPAPQSFLGNIYDSVASAVPTVQAYTGGYQAPTSMGEGVPWMVQRPEPVQPYFEEPSYVQPYDFGQQTPMVEQPWVGNVGRQVQSAVEAIPWIQQDQSNWNMPYQQPDGAEFVQGYEPAGSGAFGIGDAFGIPGDIRNVLSDRTVWDTTFQALNAPREYVGKPALGIATGSLNQEQEIIGYHPDGSPVYGRDAGGFGDVLGSIGTALTQNPVDSYWQSRQAQTEREAKLAQDSGFISGIYQGVTDPVNVATAGLGPALGSAMRTVPWLAKAAPFVEPAVAGGFGRRLAGEAAVSGGFMGGSALADQFLPENTPGRGALTMGAGLLAGGGAVAAAGGAGLKPYRPVASMVDDAGVPRVTPDVNPEFRAASDAVLEAVRKESNLRRIGIPEREIAEGRVQQVSGIYGALDEGRAAGLGGEELALAARSGAATGPLRQTFTEPIVLEPMQRAALFDEMSRMLESGEMRGFEYLTATKATQKLLAGEGLQPAEIRLLRNVFGEEVAQAVANRPQTSAQMRRAEMREIEQGRALEQKLIDRKQREAAQAIHRANREAFNAQVRRDTRELRAQGRATEQAIRDFDRAPIGAPTSGRAFDRMMQTREAAIRGVNEVDALEIAQGRRLMDEIAERQGRAEARGTQAENVRGLRAAERADRANPNTEMLIRKAEEMIGQAWPAKESLRQEGVQTIRHWLEQNDVLLDAIGKDGEQQMLGTIRAQLRGDTSNSFVTALLHRKNLLATALEHQGYEREVAQRVASQLSKMEVKSRYGDAIPAEVEALIKEASAQPSRVAGGAADLSQEFKNTMFGLDIGILGIQVTSALGTGSIPALAGLINKTLSALHLPHVNTMYADIALPKMTQYELDGVPQNMLTGIASDFQKSGTLLRLVPLGGAWADRVVVTRALEKLQELQFKSVMTPLRNTIYEGNLVMAHLARQDVTDPRVRATAAESASAITSAGKLSPNVRRATAERGLLLSPTMTRAQVQLISQMARTFNPKATATERIVGATAIASSMTGVLLVGQYLNDQFGVAEFEIDPSKPGFGNITLPNGTVINIFPQRQVVKSFAQSVRILAETEPKTAEESWQSFIRGAAREAAEPLGKMALGRLATGASVAAKAAGFGYEPGEGYKLGDYGGGAKENILNLAPIPPVIAKYFQGEVTGESIGWDITGFNNYQESDYTARDRKLINDTTTLDADGNPLFGKPFKDLDSGQQDAAVKKYGGVEFKEEPVPVETKVDIGFENLKRANTQAEEALARELARGIEGRDKLDAVKEFKASRAAAWDVAMGGDAEAWLKEHKDEPETLREGYAEMYYAVDMPLDPDGNPDFDAFYEERDKVLAKAKRAGVDTEYITGRGLGTFRGEQFEDPAVAEAVDEYEQFQAAVRESGYWDLRETAWSQVSGLPGVNPGESYDDFRERLIKITKEGLIASGYPPETAWQEAAERSSSVKALTSFNDDVYKPHFLYPWIAENPQVAFDLQKWGYYNPDAEMEALLQSYWEQGIVK